MHERPNAAFAFLLDRMPAGLFVTDATGRCVYVNEAVASLTGLGPGAPAQSWLRRIHPDYRGAVAHGWNRAIANGQVFLHDFPLSWPHEGVWVRCHAVPFAEPKRDLTGFVGSLSTIGGRPVEEARVAARQDLRRALHRGEFILLYQPIVSVADGRTVGAEALIRWIHPKKGLLYPSSFIPAAEESGQISAIGDWVIGEACRKAGRWRSETPGFSPYVAVNLSPAQFRDGTLAAKVWRFLGEAGLDPSAIELELTETLLVDEDGTMARTIGDLMDMGLGLSLDDFGMGYSNLAYLRRLSFDTLKIDRSFILGLPHDHGNAAIVRAVIQMAHALDMRVVAEGVEDRDTLRFLADHGCDLAQGYLLSRPVPFDELLAYYSAGS